jgi:hypothetical protein
MSVKDYRHLDGGADARCAWEIARWSEMARLAQDAWLNGELESLRVAQRWMRDWLEKNPVGQGIHWTSPLEGALRLMNFCWIDALTRACGDAALIAEQERIAQDFVPMHAWWVWRKKSFGSSANNHLMGELAALVMVTKRWPSLGKRLRDAESICGGWWEQGARFALPSLRVGDGLAGRACGEWLAWTGAGAFARCGAVFLRSVDGRMGFRRQR